MRIAALATYLASFALPAFGEMLGIQAFLWTFCSMAVGLFYLAPSMMVWLANPLFWYGYAALRDGNGGKAAGCGFAASCGSLSVFLLLSRQDSSAFGWGYFLWVGSMAMLTIAGLSQSMACRRVPNHADETSESFAPRILDGRPPNSPV